MIGGAVRRVILYSPAPSRFDPDRLALDPFLSSPPAGDVLHGKTLNILSMMGLSSASHAVDNAIVVLESIDRSQREEREPKKAALEGASHVWLAVTSSTCTTLIVFCR